MSHTDESGKEQAVLVYFEYDYPDLSLVFTLQNSLDAVLAGKEIGYLDGNEIDMLTDEITLFMYGPDADALFDAVRPTLEASPFTKDVRIILRYGSPASSAKETQVLLRG